MATLPRNPETPRKPASDAWNRWVMQTARTWEDLAETIRSTGIDSIDADHRRLTEIALEISNLVDLFDKNEWRLANIADEDRVVHTLYDCAADHFRREEALIERYGLPQQIEQKKQHQEFLRMLRGMIDDFENGRLTITVNLKSEILEWWIGHINGIDYTTFRSENWIPAVAGQAREWDEINDVIRSTMIAAIDAQHEQGGRMAVDLANLIESNPEKGKAAAAFDGFIEYAKRHFAYEEEFAGFYAIPGAEKNAAEHVEFLAALVDWRGRVVAGQAVDAVAFRRFFLEWWIGHINGTDYELLSLEKRATLVFSSKTPPERVMDFIVRTGQADIDGDHREITMFLLQIDDVIARFSESGSNGSYRAGVDFFDRLYGFCERHFARECRIMTEAAYAGFDAHMAQHRWFMAFLDKNRANFANGRITASNEMKRTLFQWWINHIRVFDVAAFGGDPEVGVYGGRP